MQQVTGCEKATQKLNNAEIKLYIYIYKDERQDLARIETEQLLYSPCGPKVKMERGGTESGVTFVASP